MPSLALSRILAVAACLACVISARPLFAQSEDIVFPEVESPWVTHTPEPRRGEAEELETDRDSFTFATTTVQRGRVLMESAYTFIDNRSTPDSHSFPELITRIGLTDRIELRLGWNYEVGGGGDVTGADSGGGFEENRVVEEAKFLYGLKFAVSEQQSWLPASAFIVQASTPTAGPENAGRFMLGYVTGWTFLDNWKLDSAFRYSSAAEEEDHFNQWAPSIVLKTTIAENWNVHAEYFGVFTDGRENNNNAQYFSPGVHYLLTPDCEIGLRVGWGLNNDAANFFSNVGLGLLF